jgi:hypothetical protein
MIVIQPKGKDHIKYIRQLAKDILISKGLSIDECIKEALEWHRKMCHKSDLDEQKSKQKGTHQSRCIHQWLMIADGISTGETVWQCEFCGMTEVEGEYDD